MTSYQIIDAIRSLVPMVQAWGSDPHAELEARLGIVQTVDGHRVTPESHSQHSTFINNVTSEEFETTLKMMSEYTGWINNPLVNIKDPWTIRMDRFWYKKDAQGRVLRDEPFIRSTRIGNFGEPKYYRIEKKGHLDFLCPGKTHDVRVGLKREVPIECKTEELGTSDETRLKFFQNYSNEYKWPLQWAFAMTCIGANAPAAAEASKKGQKQYEIEIEVMRSKDLFDKRPPMNIAAVLLENILKLFIDKAMDKTYTLYPIVSLHSKPFAIVRPKITHHVTQEDNGDSLPMPMQLC